MAALEFLGVIYLCWLVGKGIGIVIGTWRAGRR
jgi:hypothetical protein